MVRGGTAASPCGQGAFLKMDQSQVLALLWGDLPDFQSSLAFPFSFIRAVNEKSLPYRNLLHRYDNSDNVQMAGFSTQSRHSCFPSPCVPRNSALRGAGPAVVPACAHDDAKEA